MFNEADVSKERELAFKEFKMTCYLRGIMLTDEEYTLLAKKFDTERNGKIKYY
jgi:hypothetical protein